MKKALLSSLPKEVEGIHGILLNSMTPSQLSSMNLNEFYTISQLLTQTEVMTLKYSREISKSSKFQNIKWEKTKDELGKLRQNISKVIKTANPVSL